MLFKAASIFTFTKPLAECLPLVAAPSGAAILRDGAENLLDWDAVEQALAARAFVPVGPLEAQRAGFVPPLKGSEALIHRVEGRALVCVRHDVKRLRLADLKAEKRAEFEAKHGRTPSKAERNGMDEELAAEWLPKTLPTSRLIHAYVDLSGPWFVVGACGKPTDTVAHALRQALGSWPVAPLRCQHDPAEVMTTWLDPLFDGEPDIRLGQSCDLVETCEDPGKVAFRKKDLDCEEVHGLIAGGSRVRRLGFTLVDGADEVADVTLTDSLDVKRLVYPDLVRERAVEAAGEDADAAMRFEADFLLSSGTIRRLTAGMLAWFGGRA